MKIGVIQLCSSLDYQSNLKKIRDLLQDAQKEHVEAVFLPECFYSMSDGTKPTTHLIDPSGGEHLENIRSLAKDFSLYILGGSAATLSDSGKAFNRAYNYDPQGNLLGVYDKMNLFACNISQSFQGKEKTVLDESQYYQAGTSPLMLDIGDWKLGLSICFDLRFPEFFRNYSMQGVNLITISSAFTAVTGKVHWRPLLQARAIENQCYVVAANQWGENNSKITTWGHSMIIDPWGKIIANAENGEKLITAELEIDLVQQVRQRMDVLR